MSTNTASSQAAAQLVVAGNTATTIAFSANGQESVCLQSASQGEQVLENFNPALGDVIRLDNILGLTLAQTNLANAANYITSAVVNGSTVLYFDPTGSGAQGTPIALLVGVQTTIAALIDDGGLAYVPQAITMAPVFNTAFTFRSAGLETLQLNAPATGIAAQQINGFNPANGDVLNVTALLNTTNALPNLANLGNYITAKTTGGNTILSIDPTGTGAAGTAFAVLEGVSITIAQLLADHALAFNPTAVVMSAAQGAATSFRPEGNETLVITPGAAGSAATLGGFLSGTGDVISIAGLLAADKITAATLGNIASYLHSVSSGGQTTLYLNPAGTTALGSAVAVLQNTTTSVQQLLAQGAISLTAGAGSITTANTTYQPIPQLVTLGNTASSISFRSQGFETVRLQGATSGEQVLANFNPGLGDVISLDNVLALTQAQANLSDLRNYVTSSVVGGNTILDFDPTGHGATGTPIAEILGVQTTIAALAADGGVTYTPEAIVVTPSFNTAFTFRDAGLETLLLSTPPNGIAPQQIDNFNPCAREILDLSQVLNPTNAVPNLSNVQDFITATQSGANTILSVIPSGVGTSGTSFAVLENIHITLAQLLGENALAFEPSALTLSAAAGAAVTLRPEGNETLNLAATSLGSPTTIYGFSLTTQDAIDPEQILAAHGISATLANITHYISATSNGISTTLGFDKTGSGAIGTPFAVLENASVTMTQLLAHGGISLS